MGASFVWVIALGFLPLGDAPTVHADGVVVELFAENPQLVTPTGIAVDRQGRVFVAESHTHFRPDDYSGPESDRILILQDTVGNGRADKRSVFHEGFTHVMDLEFCSDGSLYVATRMDIHRMRDTNGDGKADEVTAIVQMTTRGVYPHNGISGLCFDSAGWLSFGLGENLGENYTLTGTDNASISGGGEGGSTYRVKADGTGLQRVSTGWWNPWGMCFDSRGRCFGTDNDPGASPPCRLIQIHDGADYGYEYRYGRTGLHPLVSWTGDLPGNIPMIAGTGEAPCGIIAAERTNLPVKLRKDLLVACWADHSIERYAITQPRDSGQVKAERHVMISGPNNFRPVGLAVAPNGDIYVSDWVSASYQLHGLGRIWRIRTDPYVELTKEAPAIEYDAKNMAEEKVRLLRDLQMGSDVSRQLGAIEKLTSLFNVSSVDWASTAYPVAVRAKAVRSLSLSDEAQAAAILKAAESSDPLLRHAAVQAMAAQTDTAAFQTLARSATVPVLLAMKRSADRKQFGASDILDTALMSDDRDLWGVAVKWIADDLLQEYRPKLQKQLGRATLTVYQYLMLTAAIDRLDGKKPSDVPSNKQLAKTILEKSSSISLRSAALRLLDPASELLPLQSLLDLTENSAASLRVSGIQHLAQRSESKAVDRLLQIATDASALSTERLEAIAALTNQAANVRVPLIQLACDADLAVAEAALQSLVGTVLTEEEKTRLKKEVPSGFVAADAVRRVTGERLARPDAQDSHAWLELLKPLDAPGDAAAGERIFFHARIGTCGRCHQHGGRGTAVGPNLSLIARRLPDDETAAKHWLLETILLPSKDMAPQYTPWTVVTKSGRQLTGLPRRKGGRQEAYLGIDGKEFTVRKDDIEFHQESRKSIMPEGLLQNLTVQELRDLFAFLLSRSSISSR